MLCYNGDMKQKKMLPKTAKILIVIFSIVAFLALASFLTIYFLFLHHYKGKSVVDEWHETDTFSIAQIATIEKQKDKDFVILNLADVQMADLENFFDKEIMHKEISYLVEKVKPDLITLTGDQTWSNENLICLKSLISWLDGYKIPYAPVFGNHDYGNAKNSAVASVNYCCDLYEKGKYSLFKRGPSNLGSLGNYVVNIMEGEKIYKTLYMIDSGYEDKISDEQIAWVRWNAEGIRAANGGEYVDGMCFMHKPLPQYAEAYYKRNTTEVEIVGESPIVSYSLYGSSENGFFEMAKSVGVKDVVCGHQHGNRFTLKYQGVRLTFATKTGELVGYYDDGSTNLNGATSFVLSGENDVEIKNTYVGSNQFHFKNSDNIAKK